MLVKLINYATSALEGIQISLNSLDRLFINDVYTYSLQVKAVCVITNASHCTWNIALALQERLIQKLKEKTIWTSKLDPDGLWDLFSWLSPGPRLGAMVEASTELASSCCMESYP